MKPLSSLLLALYLLLSGCIAIGTGSRGAGAPSKGQELMDLQRAFERGAIDQQEYDLARRRILEE